MKSGLVSNKEYKVWIASIKSRVRTAQIKAVVKVNTELLMLYWGLGAEIVEKQKKSKWGEGFLTRMSKDLTTEFPDMKGFSKRNLELIRQWFLFYSRIAKQAVSQLPKQEYAQQLIAQITQIPWGHNIAIISKCKTTKEALYYVQNTSAHNWSRSVLVHQIESHLYKRKGKSTTNFPMALPKPQSDLAHQTLKDPYIFDFMTISNDFNERDLENKLMPNLEIRRCFNALSRTNVAA